MFTRVWRGANVQEQCPSPYLRIARKNSSNETCEGSPAKVATLLGIASSLRVWACLKMRKPLKGHRCPFGFPPKPPMRQHEQGPSKSGKDPDQPGIQRNSIGKSLGQQLGLVRECLGMLMRQRSQVAFIVSIQGFFCPFCVSFSLFLLFLVFLILFLFFVLLLLLLLFLLFLFVFLLSCSCSSPSLALFSFSFSLSLSFSFSLFLFFHVSMYLSIYIYTYIYIYIYIHICISGWESRAAPGALPRRRIEARRGASSHRRVAIALETKSHWRLLLLVGSFASMC